MSLNALARWTPALFVASVVSITLASPAAGQSAPQVDLVIAIDSSGSMAEEIVVFQGIVNEFAQAITSGDHDTAAVDLHVIVIAGADVCVPPPLGSGNCLDDSNLPQYRHVQTDVGGGEPLVKILSTYEQWSASLRPNATRAVMAITDEDDSNIDASYAFHATLLALDPSFEGYRFYGVTPGSNLCGGPFSEHDYEYYFLAINTSGVHVDICDFNWPTHFDTIASSIVAQLPSFTPEPPPPPPPSQPAPGKIGIVSSSSSAGVTVELIAATGGIDPLADVSASVNLSGDPATFDKACVVSAANPQFVELLDGVSRFECQLDAAHGRVIVKFQAERLPSGYGYTGQAALTQNGQTIFAATGSTAIGD